MAEQYSNLEVAPTDSAAQAPEVVPTSAPERDFTNESPEVDKKHWPLSPDGEHPALRPPYERKKSDDAPETGALDGTFPRERGDREGLKEAAPDYSGHAGPPAAIQPDHGLSNKDEKPTSRQRRRSKLFWILVGVGILILVGVALGVGLGVGLSKRQTNISR